jgi:polyhydroxybutyrate depolymerase
MAAAFRGGRALELRRVDSGGRTRWYRVHVPPSYQPGVPTPVLLGFHGGAGNAEGFAEATGLRETADRHGFIAVFPEGTGPLGSAVFALLTWNAGNCCGYAQDHNIDDVGFVRDLLDDLASQYTIDPNRIFATGLSNGGMMSYRLGLELADRLAAVAPVAGALGVSGAPQRPIPLIAFHGALDTNVPWQGGVGSGVSGTDFMSQSESLAPFVEINQARLPTGPSQVLGQAHLYVAAAPESRADIHYWWLLDQGHSWPGKPSQINPNEPFNRDVDTNEELWAFFSAHPRDRESVELGSGCGGSAAIPTLNSSAPLLGSAIVFSGANVAAGVEGELYLSAVPAAPSDLGGGCTAYLDLESAIQVASLEADGSGTWSVGLPVPFDPALNGVELRAQAVFFDSGAALGFELTNGLHLRLGI